VDLRSGACVGAEALLRWRHPTLGPIPPGEFIPLAEQTALAKPITEWVLEAAIDQVARWRHSGPAPRVSINASALNLEEPDFASRLMRTLERHRVAPDAIELEFTESALARDGSRVLDQLDELRRTGIEIAIDDFGTGYSSLSYLPRLPASILKIDRSFVRPLGSSSRDQRLVQAMIGMAHDLGYRVVAEGIETQDVYELLLAWRCGEGKSVRQRCARWAKAGVGKRMLASLTARSREHEPPRLDTTFG
jgi:EAL domain-containing protein (putative c-di-GMP-specific phosphodiesterase class I)